MQPGTALSTSCHCGRVAVRVASAPGFINACNCSLCGKHGVWWGYFARSEVYVEGVTRSYSRSDVADPAVALHFCPDCGCTTHWTLTARFAAENPDKADQMGVNMRLFSRDDLIGIELRFPDGRNWSGSGDYGYVRDNVTLGQETG